MKERPILFSGPMVRAILDGSKTQTRRIVKLGFDDCGDPILPEDPRLPCPYGQAGDRLWVKETFMPRYGGTLPTGKGFTNVRYRADDDARDCFGVDHKGQVAVSYGPDKWRPSIFCPRWASRITLEITAVRVERLQEISTYDAIAEGVPDGPLQDNEPAGKFIGSEHDYSAPQLRYRALWESINGPGSWDANPFVWVVEFKRITQS